MDIATLIAQYGYAAVFLGALFEGESVLLLAGYAAHRGYLDFAALTGVAGIGAMTGDSSFSGSAAVTDKRCCCAVRLGAAKSGTRSI